MKKLFDYIDTEDCSDCRNKIEHLKLVLDFRDKKITYYHSYEKSIIKDKKKVIIKPIVYICINHKTREIFELVEEEYNTIKKTITKKERNGK